MKNLENLSRRVGQKIRDRRKQLGFHNQGALAAKIGTDQSRVSRWESGSELPDNEYRKLIASVLGPEVFDDVPIATPTFADAIQLLGAYQAAGRPTQGIVLTLLTGDVSHLPDALSEQVHQSVAALLESLKASR